MTFQIGNFFRLNSLAWGSYVYKLSRVLKIIACKLDTKNKMDAKNTLVLLSSVLLSCSDWTGEPLDRGFRGSPPIWSPSSEHKRNLLSQSPAHWTWQTTGQEGRSYWGWSQRRWARPEGEEGGNLQPPCALWEASPGNKGWRVRRGTW